MKSLFGLILNLLLMMLVTVNCDVLPECENVLDNTFIAVPDNCSAYIHCEGSESYRGECPQGYLFNRDNSTCDFPSNVNCITTAQNGTTQGPGNATTLAPVSSIPEQSTPPHASASQSPLTVSTVATITLPSASSTPSGSDTTSSGAICPPSNSNQPENVPKLGSCTEYYLCYNGSPIEMQCPYSLEFSSVTKQCVWANEANCVANPTTTVRPLDLCKSNANGFFKYPQNCRYYYRCTSGMLTVQECPLNYGWDDNRKSCTPTGCMYPTI